ncbi:MAG: hypothetical protein PUD89_08095 [Bacteroidales bacterium]|nr:hypothetical protein [Bacteroidales bacterium]
MLLLPPPRLPDDTLPPPRLPDDTLPDERVPADELLRPDDTLLELDERVPVFVLRDVDCVWRDVDCTLVRVLLDDDDEERCEVEVALLRVVLDDDDELLLWRTAPLVWLLFTRVALERVPVSDDTRTVWRVPELCTGVAVARPLPSRTTSERVVCVRVGADELCIVVPRELVEVLLLPTAVRVPP